MKGALFGLGGMQRNAEGMYGVEGIFRARENSTFKYVAEWYPGPVTPAFDVVPDARGRAAQILQTAEGYKEQAIAEAKGQSARFTKVYEEYAKAKDVTRQRIYLETMERILGSSQKLVYDGGPSGSSIVPYLPLNELSPPRAAQPTTGQQQSGGVR